MPEEMKEDFKEAYLKGFHRYGSPPIRVNCEEIFPIDSLAITQIDLVSPFVEKTLEKGSCVTIKGFDYELRALIICDDSSGVKWAVKPRDLKPIKLIKTEKQGRFRILSQELK